MTNTAMNTIATFTPATTFPRKKGERTPQLRTRKTELEQQIAALTKELKEVNSDLQETVTREDNDFKRHIEIHNFLSAVAITNNGKVIADPNGTGVKNILAYNNVKAVQDYNGFWFASIKDMCEWYSIDYNLFYSRRRNGWSLKDSLTREKKKIERRPRKLPPELRKVNYNTYYTRKRKGLPLDICEMTPSEYREWKRKTEKKEVGAEMKIG